MVESSPFRSHSHLRQVEKAKQQPFICVPGHSPYSPKNALHNQVKKALKPLMAPNSIQEEGSL